MDEHMLKEMLGTISAWQQGAEKQQAMGRKFDARFGREGGKDGKPPGEFVESSYLYIRSCDADQGFRPNACPVFWLSPDITVRPLGDLGTPTRALQAGQPYRLSAVVRNRGDLTVPAAKVEFFLVNPSLGFDIRVATRLGTGQGMVMAHSLAEISVDYQVPPGLAGHYCLFARVFSFSPLDLPYSDYALDPTVDRHVAQQNLTIIAQSEGVLEVDMIHFANAAGRIELVPADTAGLRLIRDEKISALRLVTPQRAAQLAGEFSFEARPVKAEGLRTGTERLKNGLIFFSSSDRAMTTDQQARLFTALEGAQKAASAGQRGKELPELLTEYRALTATALRSRLRITLPQGALKRGQAAAFHLRRVDDRSGRPTGGIALFLTG